MKFDVLGSNTFAAIGPVVQELLKRAGVDATYVQPPDSDNRFFNGDSVAKLYGPGARLGPPLLQRRLRGEAVRPRRQHQGPVSNDAAVPDRYRGGPGRPPRELP